MIGYFKEFDKKGNLTVFEKYEEGQIQTQAEETFFVDIRNVFHENGMLKLSGGYADNKKNGVFREYDTEGKLINSYTYKMDTLTAEGIVDESGLYQGNWKYYYSDGTLKAEGKYDHSLKEEEWKYYHPNGISEEKGKYVKGKPHGIWKWYHINGKLHREEGFRYGREDGIIIEYDTLENVLTKGEFSEGLKNGEWFYHVGDHTEQGKYVDGEKDGDWKFVYDNGKTAFEGKYVNGLADGRHKYYYKNGRIKIEGKFKQGLKEGEWKTYNEDGIDELTIEYKHGVEIRFDGIRVKEKMDPLKVNAVEQ